ncbi:methyl-accepting chemotaxis protein [Halobacillus litoralis]|uniref:methyl-accepting chemotaxis protein n=1 Tax=Halobacillus litoralis TaxID=45668 RepID=UPI0013694B31|nr:hypothetical protein [Halobacillus litoralis]
MQAQNIQEVVKTIKDIASRINLLSLNAAIEAERVGEDGRGFDIVAKEVLKLSNKVKHSIGEVRENVGLVTEEISRMNKEQVRLNRLSNEGKWIYRMRKEKVERSCADSKERHCVVTACADKKKGKNRR